MYAGESTTDPTEAGRVAGSVRSNMEAMKASATTTLRSAYHSRAVACLGDRFRV